MCFSISYTNNNPLALANRYKHKIPKFETNELEKIIIPKYYFVSGFEFPKLPVVREKGIFLCQWGLIPNWTKDAARAIEIRSKTLNAVSETAFEKPSFKNAIAKQRCILPIDGFFEWQHIANRKIPYFVHSSQNDFLSIGCIYELWTDRATGEIFDTFSIITTPANEMMSKIHNTKLRMPLILLPEDEQKWIDTKLNNDQIKDLMRPLTDEYLRAYTVRDFINNSKNNRNQEFVLQKHDYEGIDY